MINSTERKERVESKSANKLEKVDPIFGPSFIKNNIIALKENTSSIQSDGRNWGMDLWSPKLVPRVHMRNIAYPMPCMGNNIRKWKELRVQFKSAKTTSEKVDPIGPDMWGLNRKKIYNQMKDLQKIGISIPNIWGLKHKKYIIITLKEIASSIQSDCQNCGLDLWSPKWVSRVHIRNIAFPMSYMGINIPKLKEIASRN